MYARMTIARPRPEQFDEAIASIETTFVPAAREQDGYRGFLLGVDRAGHQLVGISLWESESDMTSSASASGYYQSRIAEFAGLLTAPPATMNLEVAVHDS